MVKAHDRGLIAELTICLQELGCEKPGAAFALARVVEDRESRRRRAIARYLAHGASCGTRSRKACTCGLDEALGLCRPCGDASPAGQ